jgi:hypothetical protein
MDLATHKQALAAREAHEAVIELKKIVDDAAKLLLTAEIESFRAAVSRNENTNAHKSLEDVIERVKSPAFDRAVFEVREKLETAVSAGKLETAVSAG